MPLPQQPWWGCKGNALHWSPSWLSIPYVAPACIFMLARNPQIVSCRGIGTLLLVLAFIFLFASFQVRGSLALRILCGHHRERSETKWCLAIRNYHVIQPKDNLLKCSLEVHISEAYQAVVLNWLKRVWWQQGHYHLPNLMWAFLLALYYCRDSCLSCLDSKETESSCHNCS